MPAAGRVARPGDHRGPLRRAGSPRPGHHDHAVHQPGRSEPVRRAGSVPTSPRRRAVDRGEHERLVGRPPLEHARELDQRGGVGGAARGVGHAGRVARGDHHDLAPRAARPAGRPRSPGRRSPRSKRSTSTVKPRPRNAFDHQPGGLAVARAARRGGRARPPRSCPWWSPRSGPRTPHRRAGPARAGAGGSRGRTSPAAPRARPARTPPGKCGARSQLATYNPGRRSLYGTANGVPPAEPMQPGPQDPPRRRRAVGAEAARVPAAQGGLRGRVRARRPGGARPPERHQLRPDRARPDAAQRRRLRGLPPGARAQLGADHHAHRQDRGDRQGARPGAGRRRLHHQAVLGPGVPQPGEGGAAPRRARQDATTPGASRSRTATC